MIKNNSKKMSKMSLMFIAVAVLLVAVFGFVGTYAFFTAQTKELNTDGALIGTVKLSLNGSVSTSTISNGLVPGAVIIDVEDDEKTTDVNEANPIVLTNGSNVNTYILLQFEAYIATRSGNETDGYTYNKVDLTTIYTADEGQTTIPEFKNIISGTVATTPVTGEGYKWNEVQTWDATKVGEEGSQTARGYVGSSYYLLNDGTDYVINPAFKANTAEKTVANLDTTKNKFTVLDENIEFNSEYNETNTQVEPSTENGNVTEIKTYKVGSKTGTGSIQGYYLVLNIRAYQIQAENLTWGEDVTAETATVQDIANQFTGVTGLANDYFKAQPAQA